MEFFEHFHLMKVFKRQCSCLFYKLDFLNPCNIHFRRNYFLTIRVFAQLPHEPKQSFFKTVKITSIAIAHKVFSGCFLIE